MAFEGAAVELPVRPPMAFEAAAAPAEVKPLMAFETAPDPAEVKPVSGFDPVEGTPFTEFEGAATPEEEVEDLTTAWDEGLSTL